MSDFDRKNIARYTLIMAQLEWLYANNWLSDEAFNRQEEVYAQKHQIPENSIFKYKYK